MFQAQYLHKGGSVLSPWIPRQGDRVMVVAEQIAANLGNLQIKLVHKNREDSGPGTFVTGGALTFTTNRVSVKEYAALKELVRYEMTNTDSSAKSFVLFRMLNPSWYDDIQGGSVI